ncbi:MAG: hypothetical protein DIU65_15690 [Proteobacteria bacterium]|nr:MAG: hypothetical protein DIU65_15690 [Pseudomonadota bacterium]
MFDDEARAFLQQPLIARVSTIGEDGFPHTVPTWFYLDGDEIVVISERATRKIRNLAANPKAAVQVGGEPNDSAGYLIRGEFRVSDDVGNEWTNRLTRHYETKETAEKHVEEWADLDMVVLRMRPVSVVKVWSGESE